MQEMKQHLNMETESTPTLAEQGHLALKAGVTWKQGERSEPWKRDEMEDWWAWGRTVTAVWAEAGGCVCATSCQPPWGGAPFHLHSTPLSTAAGVLFSVFCKGLFKNVETYIPQELNISPQEENPTKIYITAHKGGGGRESEIKGGGRKGRTERTGWGRSRTSQRIRKE